MIFLPISITLFLLFLLMIPLLFVLAPALAFAKMGLNPLCGYLFFVFCLLGSGVNIPVYRGKVYHEIPYDEFTLMLFRFMGIRLPRTQQQTVAVNLGGAVLPVLLSLYLWGRSPQESVLVATAVVTLVCYFLSKPVRRVGIVMPAFVPPVVSAIVALALSREYAPQVAYISGVLGTLIGADLLRLPQIKKLDAPFVSIGGAGVFDGIYLVGLVSVLLA